MKIRPRKSICLERESMDSLSTKVHSSTKLLDTAPKLPDNTPDVCVEIINRTLIRDLESPVPADVCRLAPQRKALLSQPHGRRNGVSSRIELELHGRVFRTGS